MVSRNTYDRAVTQANRLKAMYPRAMDARYDRRLDRILIRLSSGIDIGFSPQDCQGLEGARPVDLQSIEISPSGFGLHFPRLDADIYLPALLEGAFGSKRWAAARLGALGGSARSGSKARAARANGKLGGRPRKAA